MSRGLTEESKPEETEYGIADLVDINYSMIMHIQQLENKIDLLIEHLGIELD